MLKTVLIVVAIVLFAVRTKFTPPNFDIGWLGLAFFAASFLV